MDKHHHRPVTAARAVNIRRLARVAAVGYIIDNSRHSLLSYRKLINLVKLLRLQLIELLTEGGKPGWSVADVGPLAAHHDHQVRALGPVNNAGVVYDVP